MMGWTMMPTVHPRGRHGGERRRSLESTNNNKQLLVMYLQNITLLLCISICTMQSLHGMINIGLHNQQHNYPTSAAAIVDVYVVGSSNNNAHHHHQNLQQQQQGSGENNSPAPVLPSPAKATTTAASSSATTNATATTTTSMLLPKTLDMIRKQIPLDTMYQYRYSNSMLYQQDTRRRSENENSESQTAASRGRRRTMAAASSEGTNNNIAYNDTKAPVCSCMNSNHVQNTCCVRTILRGHKMGHSLLSQIFNETKLQTYGDYHRVKLGQGATENRNRGLWHLDYYNLLKETSEEEEEEEKKKEEDVAGEEEDTTTTVEANNKKNKKKKKNRNKILQESSIRDFRQVLVLRNIYDSLVSGYLYHKSGKECWLDQWGEPMEKNRKPYPNIGVWYKYVHHELQNVTTVPEQIGNDKGSRNMMPSLCEYLSITNEYDGMRAYIDYIFHSQWEAIWNNYAISQSQDMSASESNNFLAGIQQRTYTVCYEQLTNSSTIQSTVESMLGFLYDNGQATAAGTGTATSSIKWQGEDLAKKYLGDVAVQNGHATSRDPTLRSQLIDTIKQIDKDHFDHEIKWLDQYIPC